MLPFSEQIQKSRLANFLLKNFVVVLTISFTIYALIIIANTFYVSQKLIRTQALDNAEQTINILKKARLIYTTEAINNLKNIEQVKVTHDYHMQPGTVPLPVTYLKELAQYISMKAQDNQMQIKLYSDQPFPWREAQERFRDKFEEEALQFLKINPQKSFYKIEALNGKIVLRYAVADVMDISCIDCHNHYPQTPKTDWQVGDVRGILSITQSLQNTMNQVEKNMQQTLLLLVSLSTVGILGLGLAIREIYQYSRKLKNQAQVRQEAIEQAFTEIHNGPLQTLALLLREAEKNFSSSPTAITTSLKNLDDEIREIGENLTQTSQLKGLDVVGETQIRLGEGTLLNLQRPLEELFFEIFTLTLKRDFPNFSTIRVKVRDFERIPDTHLNLELKRKLCYCLEEAICNVGKHAQGTSKIVAVGKIEGRYYTLTVQDNGCGLSSTQGNRGTKTCYQLAKQLRGKFICQSVTQGGTLWQLSWPCPSEDI